jgi:hypothetical protein
MLKLDLLAALQVLQQGIASREHAEFVARLAEVAVRATQG